MIIVLETVVIDRTAIYRTAIDPKKKNSDSPLLRSPFIQSPKTPCGGGGGGTVNPPKLTLLHHPIIWPPIQSITQ
jgi:hypothetical protein